MVACWRTCRTAAGADGRRGPRHGGARRRCRARSRRVPKPEVKASPALSLSALPGDGGIRTRKHRDPRRRRRRRRGRAWPCTRRCSQRARCRASWACASGRCRAGTATAIEVGGDDGNDAGGAVRCGRRCRTGPRRRAHASAPIGHTLEFIKDQYRHCKTILALGASADLLQRCGIPKALPSKRADPGLIVAANGNAKEATRRFIEATGRHRHPERDSDPPLI